MFDVECELRCGGWVIVLGYIYCVSIVCNVDSDIDGLLVSAGFMCCVFVDYADVL